MRRWWGALAGGLAIAVGLAAVGYAVTTPGGRSFVVRVALDRAAAALGTPVAVGGISFDGDRFSVRDLRVGPGGVQLSIRRAAGRLSWVALWKRQLHLLDLSVDGAKVTLGGWTDGSGPDHPTTLPRLRVDAFDLHRITLRAHADAPPLVTQLRGHGRLLASANGWDVEFASLVGRLPLASLPALRVTGTVTISDPLQSFRSAGLHLASGRSQLTADGEVDLGGPLAVRIPTLRLMPAEAAALLPGVRLAGAITGEASIGGSPSRPVFDGSLRAAGGGTLALRTTAIGMPPVRLTGAVTFTDLVPKRWLLDAPAARARGRLRFAADRATDFWVIAHRARLGPSQIAGRTIRWARIAGHGPLDAQRSTVDIAATEGRVHARVDGHLDAGLHLTAVGTLDVPAESPLLPALSPPVRLQFTAATQPDLPLAVTASGGPLRLAGIDLAAVAVEGHVREATFQIDRGTIQTGAATLQVTGTIDPQGAQTALVATGMVDLRAAEPRLGAGVTGLASATGRATGPWPPTVTATLRSPSLGIAGGRLDEATIEASLNLVSQTGSVTLAAARLSINEVPPSPLHARLTWAPEGPAIRAVCEEFQWRPWRLTAPAVLRLADGVAVEPLRLQDDHGASLTLQGRVGGTLGHNLSLRLTQLPLSPLCARAGAGACRGRIDGTARLVRDEVATDLRVQGIAVSDVTYGDLDVHVQSRGQRLGVEATLQHPTAGTLALHGAIPGWATASTGPLELRLTTEGLNPGVLAALFPAHLRHVRGRLASDLAIGGSWRTPRLGGELSLLEGSIALATNGVTYNDLTLRLAGDGSDLRVREMTARTGEGRLDGEGSVHLGGPERLALALDLRLDRAKIADRPAVSAAATGTLHLRGPLERPSITGGLELADTTLRPALLPIGRTDLEPDPTIKVIDSRTAAPHHITAPTIDPPAPVTLDIAVRLGRDCWIRRSDAALAMSGDLRVVKELPRPARLVGRLGLGRGWYTFQAQRFYIEGGSVTFRDTEPAATVLDVTASYRSAEYTVTAKVGGSLERPALTLFSDPPLPEADVLALLLFGKPTQQLGASESGVLQNQVAAIATGYVAPGLRASVMDALGIDTLDVALPPSGADTVGQVRVGRYVAEDLFVSLAQEFGAGVAQVFGIEYAVSRRVSIKASAATNGRGAIDVFWHRRY